MDETKALSPNDISKRIFTAVGPARIAAHAALAEALRSAGGDERSSSRSDHAASTRERIAGARKMLSEGVERLFADGGFEAPAHLGAKRAAAQSAVEDLSREIGVGRDAPGVISVKDPKRFADEIVARVDATIADFLDTLDSHADEMDSAARQKEREIIKSAVGEIQTISMSINLISINASIEAARAGSAGRGFGVIANEIQTLSMRSQESLQKIMANVDQ